MNGKVIEYSVIEATYAPDLALYVQTAIQEGWQPFGSVSCSLSEDDDARWELWAQAMVRYEEVVNGQYEKSLKKMVLAGDMEFLDDIARMRRVLNEAGYTADDRVIQRAYKDFSEDVYAAGWYSIKGVPDQWVLDALLSGLEEERP